jgi:hypothetical protein
MLTLENIKTSPYPYRTNWTAKAGSFFSAKELADYTPSGFLHIISKLEGIAHNTAWAREALTAERRAYMVIHGDVEPYSVAEVASPIRDHSDLLLELRAAKRFH